MFVILSIYWGAREEKLDDLIEKTILHFSCLSGAGSALSDWVELGSSRKKVMGKQPIDFKTRESVRAILQKSVTKTDSYPKIIIPEMGYHLRFWNKARDGIDASSSLRCGVHSKFLGKDDQNLISVNVDGDRLGIEGFLALFHCLVDVWMPSGGVLSVKDNGVEEVAFSF